MLLGHHELSDFLCILLLLNTQLPMLEYLPLIDIAWPLICNAILLVYRGQQVPTEVLVRWYVTVLFDQWYSLVKGQMSHLGQGLVVAYPLYLLLIDILMSAFHCMIPLD